MASISTVQDKTKNHLDRNIHFYKINFEKADKTAQFHCSVKMFDRACIDHGKPVKNCKML